MDWSEEKLTVKTYRGNKVVRELESILYGEGSLGRNTMEAPPPPSFTLVRRE